MVGQLERPTCRASAPVKAPFSWPNSSLSMSVAGMAAQLTRTIARPCRGPRSWISVATSSLPVPVSPSSSTVASVAATCSICSRTRSMAGLRPTTRVWPSRSRVSFRR